MSKEQMENILAHKIELKIFKCETMKDVEDVDKLIITLKKNGHPMELIQYLWRQLDMVAEGIERDINQNKDEKQV